MHLSEKKQWKLQRHDRGKWRELLGEGPRPERLHVGPTAGDIQELKQSYSDCENGTDTRKGRSLCYFSDVLFEGSEVIAALEDATPGGPHAFDPAFTIPLPVGEYDGVTLSQPVWRASLAIYVNSKNSEPLPMPTPETEELLRVDEIDYINASITVIRFCGVYHDRGHRLTRNTTTNRKGCRSARTAGVGTRSDPRTLT